MATKTATRKATTTPRKGMGNTADQPTTGTPVETAALAGVVATPTTPATTTTPKRTAAEIQATMVAKTAATAARKAAAKAATPKAPAAKATPAAKVPTANQAAAKAAKQAAASSNRALVLAWLTANMGTAYAVGDVEIGTNTGPRQGASGVRTQRPTLWALANDPTCPVVQVPTAAGRKGFMVPKPTAPARKAPARKAAASK